MIAENPKIKSRFAAIDDVSADGQKLPWLLEGQYVLEVDRIKTLDARGGKFFYIAEFTIIESTNEQRPVGLQASWMTNMLQDMGPINCKRFIGAVLGYSRTEDIDANVKSDICELAANEENPMKKCRVHCQVSPTKTKAGGDFSEHRWSPMLGFSFNELNP